MGIREFVGALVLQGLDDDGDYFKRRDANLSRFDVPLKSFFNPPYDQEEEEWAVDRRK